MRVVRGVYDGIREGVYIGHGKREGVYLGRGYIYLRTAGGSLS